MSRARLFLVAFGILSLTASGAHAETQANVGVSCGYGQVARAKFKENAQSAAWEYWANITTKYWWGTETQNTDGKLYAASQGTYVVTFTPKSNTKINSIHVRSSGSVEGAAGQQCASPETDFIGTDIDCGEACDSALSLVTGVAGAVGVPVPDATDVFCSPCTDRS